MIRIFYYSKALNFSQKKISVSLCVRNVYANRFGFNIIDSK